MIAPVTRLLTKFLRDHPTHGVNPMLADFPAFGDESERPAPVPDIVDDVDNAAVAKDYDPDGDRTLITVVEFEPNAPVHQRRGLIDAKMAAGVSFLRKDVASMAAARIETEYVLLAVEDALMWMNMEPQDSPWRNLGSIRILKVERLLQVRATGGIGSATLMGSVVATIHVARFTSVEGA